MLTVRKGAWLAVVTVVGLASSMACGGDDDEPEALDDSGERVSPLEEFLGDLGAPQEDEEWRQKIEELDQAVAECMRSQGFDYTLMSQQVAGETVVNDGEIVSGEEFADDPLTLSEEDYVAQFGYGISTARNLGDGERIRPDIENVSELSPAEQAAYDQALRGDWSGYDEWVAGDISEQELVYGAPADAGCYGTATAEVFPDRSRETTRDELAEQFPVLVEASNAVEERIANDPKALDALAEWSECVADKGYPGLGSPGEAEQTILDRHETVDDTDEAALEELQADEIALATADSECQDDVGLQDVLWEVQVEHEQWFIDENRDDLEAYKDAVAAAQEEEG